MPLVDIHDGLVHHRMCNKGTSVWRCVHPITRLPAIFLPGESSFGCHAADRKEVRLQYHRYVCAPSGRLRAKVLEKQLALTPSDNVAMIGSGLGFTTEGLTALGIPAVAIDTSTWIETAKSETETSEIAAILTEVGILPITARYAEVMALLEDGGTRARVTIENEDIAVDEARARLEAKYGIFTWAISDNVLPWLDDAEAAALDFAMGEIAADVAHQVTPYNDAQAQKPEPYAVLNWKHMEGNAPVVSELMDQPWYTVTSWKALLPNSAILGVSGGIA